MDNHIIMSQKEASRYDIIQKTIKKEIKGIEAAEMLNLTDRHIRRLKKKVAKEGLQGLIHAGRGKPSKRKLPAEETEKIKKLKKSQNKKKTNSPRYFPNTANALSEMTTR